jgi:uncharacterized protein YjbI with pentapeptide repeats
MATLRGWIQFASEKGKRLAATVRPYVRWHSILAALAILWILWHFHVTGRMNVGTKTLWDWLDLMVVPLALALAGFWFSRIQKRTELEIAEKARELDREIAERAREADRQMALERQAQITLESYLDRMKELLLDRDLGTNAKPGVNTLARAWTLNVLRELSSKRSRQVLRFLQESNLVGTEQGIDLSGADLSGADLRGADLRGADLSGTNLSSANLRRAILSGANLSGATLLGTDLSGAYLSRANLKAASLFQANLRQAVLSQAILRRTDMSGADLSEAILHEADLLDANLSGADLKGAISATKDQLNRATLSDETVLPHGRSYLQWKQDTAPMAAQQAEVVTEPDIPFPPDDFEWLAEPQADVGDMPLDETAESGDYTQADAAG